MDDDKTYDEKIEHMQQYVPFLQRLVRRCKDKKRNELKDLYLSKMQVLLNLLTDRSKRVKLSILAKSEIALKSLHEKYEQNYGELLLGGEPKNYEQKAVGKNGGIVDDSKKKRGGNPTQNCSKTSSENETASNKIHETVSNKQQNKEKTQNNKEEQLTKSCTKISNNKEKISDTKISVEKENTLVRNDEKVASTKDKTKREDSEKSSSQKDSPVIKKVEISNKNYENFLEINGGYSPKIRLENEKNTAETSEKLLKNRDNKYLFTRRDRSDSNYYQRTNESQAHSSHKTNADLLKNDQKYPNKNNNVQDTVDPKDSCRPRYDTHSRPDNYSGRPGSREGTSSYSQVRDPRLRTKTPTNEKSSAIFFSKRNLDESTIQKKDELCIRRNTENRTDNNHKNANASSDDDIQIVSVTKPIYTPPVDALGSDISDDENIPGCGNQNTVVEIDDLSDISDTSDIDFDETQLRSDRNDLITACQNEYYKRKFNNRERSSSSSSSSKNERKKCQKKKNDKYSRSRRRQDHNPSKSMKENDIRNIVCTSNLDEIDLSKLRKLHNNIRKQVTESVVSTSDVNKTGKTTLAEKLGLVPKTDNNIEKTKNKTDVQFSPLSPEPEEIIENDDTSTKRTSSANLLEAKNNNKSNDVTTQDENSAQETESAQNTKIAKNKNDLRKDIILPPSINIDTNFSIDISDTDIDTICETLSLYSNKPCESNVDAALNAGETSSSHNEKKLSSDSNAKEAYVDNCQEKHNENNEKVSILNTTGNISSVTISSTSCDNPENSKTHSSDGERTLCSEDESGVLEITPCVSEREEKLENHNSMIEDNAAMATAICNTSKLDINKIAKKNNDITVDAIESTPSECLKQNLTYDTTENIKNKPPEKLKQNLTVTNSDGISDDDIENKKPENSEQINNDITEDPIENKPPEGLKQNPTEVNSGIIKKVIDNNPIDALKENSTEINNGITTDDEGLTQSFTDISKDISEIVIKNKSPKRLKQSFEKIHNDIIDTEQPSESAEINIDISKGQIDIPKESIADPKHDISEKDIENILPEGVKQSSAEINNGVIVDDTEKEPFENAKQNFAEIDISISQDDMENLQQNFADINKDISEDDIGNMLSEGVKQSSGEINNTVVENDIEKKSPQYVKKSSTEINIDIAQDNIENLKQNFAGVNTDISEDDIENKPAGSLTQNLTAINNDNIEDNVAKKPPTSVIDNFAGINIDITQDDIENLKQSFPDINNDISEDDIENAPHEGLKQNLKEIDNDIIEDVIKKNPPERRKQNFPEINIEISEDDIENLKQSFAGVNHDIFEDDIDNKLPESVVEMNNDIIEDDIKSKSPECVKQSFAEINIDISQDDIENLKESFAEINGDICEDDIENNPPDNSKLNFEQTLVAKVTTIPTGEDELNNYDGASINLNHNDSENYALGRQENDTGFDKTRNQAKEKTVEELFDNEQDRSPETSSIQKMQNMFAEVTENKDHPKEININEDNDSNDLIIEVPTVVHIDLTLNSPNDDLNERYSNNKSDLGHSGCRNFNTDNTITLDENISLLDISEKDIDTICDTITQEECFAVNPFTKEDEPEQYMDIYDDELYTMIRQKSMKDNPVKAQQGLQAESDGFNDQNCKIQDDVACKITATSSRNIVQADKDSQITLCRTSSGDINDIPATSAIINSRHLENLDNNVAINNESVGSTQQLRLQSKTNESINMSILHASEIMNIDVMDHGNRSDGINNINCAIEQDLNVDGVSERKICNFTTNNVEDELVSILETNENETITCLQNSDATTNQMDTRLEEGQLSNSDVSISNKKVCSSLKTYGRKRKILDSNKTLSMETLTNESTTSVTVTRNTNELIDTPKEDNVQLEQNMDQNCENLSSTFSNDLYNQDAKTSNPTQDVYEEQKLLTNNESTDQKAKMENLENEKVPEDVIDSSKESTYERENLQDSGDSDSEIPLSKYRAKFMTDKQSLQSDEAVNQSPKGVSKLQKYKSKRNINGKVQSRFKNQEEQKPGSSKDNSNKGNSREVDKKKLQEYCQVSDRIIKVILDEIKASDIPEKIISMTELMVEKFIANVFEQKKSLLEILEKFLEPEQVEKIRQIIESNDPRNISTSKIISKKDAPSPSSASVQEGNHTQDSSPKKKQKYQRCSRELESLNEDIKNNMSIVKDILKSSGRRSCSIEAEVKTRLQMKYYDRSSSEDILSHAIALNPKMCGLYVRRTRGSQDPEELLGCFRDGEQYSALLAKNKGKKFKNQELSETEHNIKDDNYSRFSPIDQNKEKEAPTLLNNDTSYEDANIGNNDNEEQKMEINVTRTEEEIIQYLKNKFNITKNLQVRLKRINIDKYFNNENNIFEKNSEYLKLLMSENLDSEETVSVDGDNGLLQPVRIGPFNKQSKRTKRRSVHKDMLNTDRDYHCQSEQAQICLICMKTRKNLVQHYVNMHKNCEVMISRLPQSDVDILFNSPPIAYRMGTKFRGECIFCKVPICNKINNWFEHIFGHTGEYMYECLICDTKRARKSEIHHLVECDAQNVVQLFVLDENVESIKAFVCNMCNYIQCREVNMLNHVVKQHKFAGQLRVNYREVTVISFYMTPPQHIAGNTQTNENENENEEIIFEIETNPYDILNEDSYNNENFFPTSISDGEHDVDKKKSNPFSSYQNDENTMKNKEKGTTEIENSYDVDFSPILSIDTSSNKITTNDDGNMEKQNTSSYSQNDENAATNDKSYKIDFSPIVKFDASLNLITSNSNEAQDVASKATMLDLPAEQTTETENNEEFESEVILETTTKIIQEDSTTAEKIPVNIITDNIVSSTTDENTTGRKSPSNLLGICSSSNTSSPLNQSVIVSPPHISRSLSLSEVVSAPNENKIDTHPSDSRIVQTIESPKQTLCNATGVNINRIVNIGYRFESPSVQIFYCLVNGCSFPATNSINGILAHVQLYHNHIIVYDNCGTCKRSITSPTVIPKPVDEVAHIKQYHNAYISVKKDILATYEPSVIKRSHVEDTRLEDAVEPLKKKARVLEPMLNINEAEVDQLSEESGNKITNVGKNIVDGSVVIVLSDDEDASNSSALSNTETALNLSVGNNKRRKRKRNELTPVTLLLKPWVDLTLSRKSKQFCETLQQLEHLYRLFKCMGDNCIFTTNSVVDMGRHLYEHETQLMPQPISSNNIPKSWLECSYCDVYFQTGTDLINHTIACHNSSAYQCSRCFYRNETMQNVSNHQKVFHEGEVNLNILVGDVLISSQPKRVEPQINSQMQRPECNPPEFNRPTEINKNISQPPHVNKYFCPHCSYNSQHVDELRHHVGSVHLNQSHTQPSRNIRTVSYRESMDIAYVRAPIYVPDDIRSISANATLAALNAPSTKNSPPPYNTKQLLAPNQIASETGSPQPITDNREHSNNVNCMSAGTPIPKYVQRELLFVCHRRECKGENFWNAENFQIHILNKHMHIKMLVCVHCKKNLKPSKFIDHLLLHSERIYQCFKCRFIHYNYKELVIHIYLKHGTHKQCIAILLRGAQEGVKYIDLLEYKNEQIWSCKFCEFADRIYDDIEHHLSVVHKIYPEFKCDKCGYVYRNAASFKEHSLFVHSNEQIPTNTSYTKPVVNLYNKKVGNIFELNYEASIVPSNEQTKLVSVAADNLIDKSSSNQLFEAGKTLTLPSDSTANLQDVFLTCTYCPLFFNEVIALLNHWQTKHINHPFQFSISKKFHCFYCNAGASFEYLKVHHARNHPSSLFKVGNDEYVDTENLSISSADVITNELLEKYIYIGNLSKSMECPKCNVIIKDNEYLQHHQQNAHNNECIIEFNTHEEKSILYGCNPCKIFYSDEKSIMEHFWQHLRSYRCIYCPKEYQHYSNLSKHYIFQHGKSESRYVYPEIGSNLSLNFIKSNCVVLFSNGLLLTKDNLANTTFGSIEDYCKVCKYLGENELRQWTSKDKPNA